MANAGAGERRHVLESFYSGFAFVFILISRCHASSIDVYRLIQYDISGAPFGSRSAYLNHYAASSISIASGSDLSSNVLILYLHELDETFMREYIQHGKPLGGLLLLLPQSFGLDNFDLDGIEAGPADFDYTNVKQKLVDLEQKLIHCTIQYPVYFAFESQDLDDVIANIRRNDAAGQPATVTTGGYKLIVTSPTPKKLASSSIINIKGWLPGLKADGDSNQLPTIAIVASYDTFGAVPALSVGSDSNGSGVVALLEIARLFSVLYSSPNTRGQYNILFGLTSGGPYNYNGTQNWLRSFDKGLLESIDYAICLNSLGSVKDRLWLHVSESPKNAYVKQIFEGLSNVAEELGLTVGIKHEKINASNSRVAWEHEQFSRMGVTAATLSGLSVAPNLLENTGGISDQIGFVNEESVAQGVRLVVESLARHIYGKEWKNISIFAAESGLTVSPVYIRWWLDILSETPRVAPYLSKEDAIIFSLKKELAYSVVEVKLQHDVIDHEMFAFYDSTVNTLEIYKIAGVTFVLLPQLFIGSCLIVLINVLMKTRVWMMASVFPFCLRSFKLRAT